MIREKGLLPQDFALRCQGTTRCRQETTPRFEALRLAPRQTSGISTAVAPSHPMAMPTTRASFRRRRKATQSVPRCHRPWPSRCRFNQEMKQMADAFKTLFGREGPGVSEVTSSEVWVGCLFFKDRAPDGTRSEVTRRTRNAVLNTDGASDSVPSWIRKEFCHQVLTRVRVVRPPANCCQHHHAPTPAVARDGAGAAIRIARCLLKCASPLVA